MIRVIEAHRNHVCDRCKYPNQQPATVAVVVDRMSECLCADHAAKERARLAECNAAWARFMAGRS